MAHVTSPLKCFQYHIHILDSNGLEMDYLDGFEVETVLLPIIYRKKWWHRLKLTPLTITRVFPAHDGFSNWGIDFKKGYYNIVVDALDSKGNKINSLHFSRCMLLQSVVTLLDRMSSDTLREIITFKVGTVYID